MSESESAESELRWNRRWDGTPGRLEVWYATFTDRETGNGLWIHGETVAPVKGSGTAVTSHGWAALFPTGVDPVWERTGVDETSSPADLAGDHPETFSIEGLNLGPSGSSGKTETLSWDLRWDSSDQAPVSTIPHWAWKREILPAAQQVPAPNLEASGWVEHHGTKYDFDGHGQVARIYGQGNALRWGWLHADLGDGDVIEVVTAVSKKVGLRKLPPTTFLRMRVGGEIWPKTRVASWGLRAKLGLPDWSIRGRTQGVEVNIEVEQPADRCVSIDYTDPDGETATCTNTERANLTVDLRTQNGIKKTWKLGGTAHAEIGTRP